jgi:uncharacterized protein YdaU (DUF1376 family)
MSDRRWMPLDIADYLKDTRHLTTLEHGAYLLLIMRYWEDGGLPDNDALVARYAGLNREQWAESRDVLAAFFDSGWKHKRIDAELARAAEIMEKRRASGKLGGSTRQASAKQTPDNSQHTYKDNNLSSSLRSDESAPASKPTPRQRLEAVLDAERVEAVLEHRQRLRKPLTERAAKLLAADLAKFDDPNAAADTMVKRGWLGIEPGWGERPPSQAGPAKRSNPLSDAFGAMRPTPDDRPSETVSGPVRYLPAASG